eukprot:m.156110 g.156110  ORF g.156110 m.156110 type:complete len:118 (-) comp24676_c0_seq5:733-1086(-)
MLLFVVVVAALVPSSSPFILVLPLPKPTMTETFTLQHPGTCTGMFWRKNPDNDGEKQQGGDDWPRNGSLLTGTVHQKSDMKWLEVSKWQPAGTSKWIEDCKGLWMPFEQNGLLLHKK